MGKVGAVLGSYSFFYIANATNYSYTIVLIISAIISFFGAFISYKYINNQLIQQKVIYYNIEKPLNTQTDRQINTQTDKQSDRFRKTNTIEMINMNINVNIFDKNDENINHSNIITNKHEMISMEESQHSVIL